MKNLERLIKIAQKKETAEDFLEEIKRIFDFRETGKKTLRRIITLLFLSSKSLNDFLESIKSFWFSARKLENFEEEGGKKKCKRNYLKQKT